MVVTTTRPSSLTVKIGECLPYSMKCYNDISNVLSIRLDCYSVTNFLYYLVNTIIFSCKLLEDQGLGSEVSFLKKEKKKKFLDLHGY